MNMQDYMDRLELKYDNPYIQVPNNLIKNLTHELRQENCESYVPYAYAFIIANAFLYKYAHYIDLDNDDYINTSNIKTMLKYNPESQKINKVSKKNGILENKGFIEVTTDIPLSVEWEKDEVDGWDRRLIVNMSDSDDYIRKSIYENVLRTRRFYSHIPEFMIDYKTRAGTLNDYRNTYRITYSEFKRFIFDENMSLRDLLFYSHLKSLHNISPNINISYDTIKRQTGISHSTVKKITEKLEKEEIITATENKNISRLKGTPKTYKIKKKFLMSMNKRKKKTLI